jgi:transposase-like protein
MQEAIHHNSSHFAAISDAGLSPVQAQVIEALAQGQTVSAAAEKAGIHRTTIHHWIRTEPAFKLAAETARTEYADELNDGLRELAIRAVLTLHDLLQDISTPPAVRLKTALAILQRPHAPNPGWNLPIPIETQPIETNHDATPIAGAKEPDAPKTQPPAPAPIARCAPCPCGSGRKYKRCCAADATGLPITPDANPRAA